MFAILRLFAFLAPCLGITLACMPFANALAQQTEWSNTQKLRGSSIYTTIIGEDESGIYVFRHRNKTLSKFVVMERYRQNLGLENSKSFMLRNSRMVYADIQSKGLFTLKQVYNKKSGQHELIAAWLNSSFEPVSEEKQILVLKNQLWGNNPFITVRPSADRSAYFILCFETAAPRCRNFSVTEINTQLETVQSRNIQIPFTSGIDKVHEVVIDHHNQYCILANQYRSKAGKPAPVILEQTGDSCSIKLPDEQVQSASDPLLYYNPVQKIKVLTGYYTRDQTVGIEGSFAFIWGDERHREFKPVMQAFSASMLKKLEGESAVASGILPQGYHPLKIIGRSDGGFVVVGENAFVQKDQDIMVVNGVASTQGKSIYNFENVLIQNFDSSGFLAWEHGITKTQTTVNDGGMLGSVLVAADSRAVHVLYNDPIAPGGDILIASLFSGGTKEQKILAKGDEMNAFIVPSDGKQISKDKMIVPVLKDRKFALLKVTFK